MTTEAKVQDRTAVDVALLTARVIVGIVFMAHGAQKLFGAFGGPGLSAFVQMMGPLGYLVAIGEFFGGLGLVVGFLARFSAASISLIMLGAIAMVHAKAGFFMNWTGKQAGEGFEYHLLAIAPAAHDLDRRRRSVRNWPVCGRCRNQSMATGLWR